MAFARRFAAWAVPVPDPLDEPTPEALDAALANDPAFSVMTEDGVGWIDPWSGEVVPVLLDHRPVARAHLLATRPWRTRTRRSLEQVIAVRWLHALRHHLARDERFRTFAPDGRWMNPYTGGWVRGVRLVGERVGLRTLEDIAAALSACPEAQSGQPLAKDALEAIASSEVRTSPADPTTDAFHAMAEGMQRAKLVIERLLPRLPALPGWRFDAHYEPQQAIGGDFYDVIARPGGRLLVVIGDVAGHGPEAALVVVAVLKTLRTCAKRHPDSVPAVLADLNDELMRDDNHQPFLTLFALELDLADRRAICWCAGHHPALLINRDRPRPIAAFGAAGPAIGIMPGAQLRPALTPVSLALMPGDTLLLCTDGLFEVTGGHDEQFGQERLILSCAATLDRPGRETVEHAVANARRFATGHRFTDDVTVLAVSCTDDPPV
jgi:serine phosphatase RsbU (regulator of sigma subunit)